jgi:EAL domain-containing protein (putative c-di-GMP-specific phosphodiesterase class I)
MAFQPIVEASTQSVYAFEALVRGSDGAPAWTVLQGVDENNRYGFDQACRIRAIELAAKLGLPEQGGFLSINFLPNAVYEPRACIRATLATAERVNFPLDRLIFEITEVEEVADDGHLTRIVSAYREMGFKTAIDDFGAGFSNLTLLAKFQPDIIKLDMELIRGIDADRVRRSLVRSMVAVCEDIGCLILAEGVETADEYAALRDIGIDHLQGYLLARPGFETLPSVAWPEAGDPIRLSA